VFRHNVAYESLNTNTNIDPASGTGVNWVAEVGSTSGASAPANPTTPSHWIKVVTGDGIAGFIPIYQ
jgi:hypothetical protein